MAELGDVGRLRFAGLGGSSMALLLALPILQAYLPTRSILSSSGLHVISYAYRRLGSPRVALHLLSPGSSLLSSDGHRVVEGRVAEGG